LNTSTASEKVRVSPGCNAPTPTTWRAISSPRSLRIASTTEYSHEPQFAGWRSVPSTRSGVAAGCTR